MFYSDDDVDFIHKFMMKIPNNYYDDQNVRAAKTTAFMVGALIFCYIPLIGEFDDTVILLYCYTVIIWYCDDMVL